ncbi:hypothetical protein Sb01g032160 [Rhodovulum sulfidophilum]|uniref:Uncharacterized protein n=1 Tax=Rhodovulum sulfidophilum TaxID=35806 RepID=A0A0D6B1K2_RHOSU|nr:hypothetical protein Sb01g032160 [Rhodovulum sulfidophilum]
MAFRFTVFSPAVGCPKAGPGATPQSPERAIKNPVPSRADRPSDRSASACPAPGAFRAPPPRRARLAFRQTAPPDPPAACRKPVEKAAAIVSFGADRKGDLT